MNFKFAKVKTDEICRFFSYTRKGRDSMPNGLRYEIKVSISNLKSA